MISKKAIRRVLDEHPDVKAIYPIHMNPVVRKAVDEELGDCDRIHIIEPIEVFDWLCVIRRSVRRAWKRDAEVGGHAGGDDLRVVHEAPG